MFLLKADEPIKTLCNWRPLAAGRRLVAAADTLAEEDLDHVPDQTLPTFLRASTWFAGV